MELLGQNHQLRCGSKLCLLIPHLEVSLHTKLSLGKLMAILLDHEIGWIYVIGLLQDFTSLALDPLFCDIALSAELPAAPYISSKHPDIVHPQGGWPMPFIRNGTSKAFNAGSPWKSGAQLFSKQAAPAHRESRGLQISSPPRVYWCTDLYLWGEGVYSEPIIQIPSIFCS